MTGFFGRIFRLLPINIVLMVSLLVLAYVGFGEGSRTYPVFVLDKLAAQGQSIKNSIDTYLQAGLPLNQFPGFRPLSTPMLESDSAILEIFVADPDGKIVFSNKNQKAGQSTGGLTRGALIGGAVRGLSQAGLSRANYSVTEDSLNYRVVLPLRNRFETVGELSLTTPKGLISDTLFNAFLPVFYVLIGLGLVYFIFLFLTEHRWGKKERAWLQVSYGLVFIVMVGYVLFVLISIYSNGIQERTKALAQSLSQRLNQVLELGLDISDISGLQRTFADYKRLNPDISYVALTSDNRIVIHTNPKLVGEDWKPLEDHFKYALPLRMGSQAGTQVQDAQVNVGIPKNLVYSRLWRSIKNFSVLFIASAFISFFLLDVLLAVRHSRRAETASAESQRDFNVELVRPVFFLGVFIEGTHISFLPQYFREIISGSGFDPSLTSWLFTLFFAGFALILLPAGRYAEKRGVKNMMLLGILLSSAGLGAMAVVTDLYQMGAIRIVAGIGQGLIFISCQSYILKMASQAKKTQGAAIIVFGYNGGFISGAAIGALLVTTIGPTGVFSISAILGVLILIYVLATISEVPILKTETSKSKLPLGQGVREFFSDVGKVLVDFQFFKSMLLIGITTKAVLTGVTIFALPGLMFRAGYAQEDIGQILMFYSGGVLLSSQFISRIVDRTGRTREILFLGTIGSGIGLILIGMMGREEVLNSALPFLGTFVLIGGMTILGLSHGFINAPIITHIAASPVASRIGKTSTISLYRFLERFGHVLGPVIVGQLLIMNAHASFTISWIGGATFFFALLFFILPGKSRTVSGS